ncbi:SH3 domain-containing protein [Mesorhizobium sp.]|uniref:jacalin-like lectin n=1 Tax=Mesorhizobium sp. TaxID=1871066 RepID=UPI000FEAA872|nr:SH3 domain-containing protein [Mesorhizobium sp.]RWM38864.1 MAG: SH3 domain-containing protein [Mesorhizobium sp.]
MSSYRALHSASCLLIALCLLAAPSLATNAFAEREAGSFGGQGGAPFHGTCSPKALAGVFLRAGKALDTVMIDCGTLNKNGTVTDVIGDAHFHAGGSGGDPFSVGQFCPQNALVTGMRVWKDHNNMVNSFILRCTSMTDGTNTWTTMRARGEAINDPVKILCKKNEIGIGIYGRAGSLIDNIGLLCADNPMKVADAPPPPVVPEKPIKHTGKAGGDGAAPTPGGVLSCRGGGGMKMTISGQTAVFIAFTPAAQTANAAQPGPGECAWPDRLFAANEAHRFALDPGKPNAQLLMDAVRTGGTFQLAAVPIGTFIMVNAINNVQVMDNTPLSPEPAGGEDQTGGNDAGGGGTPQTPADMGGMPPMQQADGTCGDGNAMARVVINQPGLDKLNVRSGPGGQVVGTVPEGSTVSVIGPCGSVSGAAGFTKPKTQQGGGGGGGGWCQIGAPVHGCVSARFLAFGDVGQPGGAAGIVRSKGKHQALAPATASFGGSWSANADNVAYSLSLKQNGNGVSGRYQGNDGSAGQINGKVSGSVLRFSWVQKDGTTGSGKFVLAGDGQSFNGSYSFSNDPDAIEGSWNGTRQ